MSNGSAEVRKCESATRLGGQSRCWLADKMTRGVASAMLVGTVAMMGGCTDAAGYDLDVFWGNFPFMSDMRESVSYDPYEMPRLPAEGSIPIETPGGDGPPPFTATDLTSGNLPPIERPFGPTPEAIERGEQMWLRQCSVCHGADGQGNGPVVGPTKFPTAPSVVTPVAAGHSDEYLYGIIRVGRGLMPPYGARVQHADRWAIVYFMRQLQQQGGLTPAATPAQVSGEPLPDLPAEAEATTPESIVGETDTTQAN